MSGSEYHLGSDAAELNRLARQGAALAPATRMLLQAAGIGPGMRVLDLGCGAGDVSFAVAELVGPTGSVLGIDRSPEAVVSAKARAKAAGLDAVTFVEGDIHQPAPDGPFDAIVGRLVLMYVPDPAAVLATQATQLRPGGLVAPIEFDMRIAGSLPAVPLVTQLLSWIGETFQRANIAPALGTQLWSVLRKAGLTPRGMIGVQPHFGSDDANGSALLAGIVKSLLPVIERTGVAKAEDIAIETLASRLSADFAAADAVFVHPALLTAWATKG
ncbi:class I SAM-dependent methyltransferase [Pendulispora albinea]|uniref:Class I SAM-dependent methyltransferase n=1 Tax=Pendulispora albinea TaxID=2741071 RepID=A0ABZ2M6G1_9BACT